MRRCPAGVTLAVAGVLGLAACAVAPVAVEAGRAVQGDAPTSDDDLERAWSAPPGSAAASPEISVRDSPKPVDHRTPFREALSTAQAALGARRFDDARGAVRTALAKSAPLPPEERDLAWALAFKVEHTAADAARTRELALEWRRACVTGPCRSRAVAALAQIAGQAPLAKRLREAEACLTQAERARVVPPCLARVSDPTGDDVFAARVALVRAWGEKVEARRTAALLRVEASCTTSPGCLGVRRAALAKLASRALETDPQLAVKYLVRDGQLLASQVSPELQAWARTSELDAACARLDARAGAGACRALERQLSGGWTFRDYSLEHAGEGLTPDRVRMVNEHYAPLLQACLTEQARRLTPPDAQTFELRWTVHNDGRVRDAHLRPDLDQLPLAKCLRAQFSSWRYPRFEGELQNIEQAFTVTANRR
jgi:hypothetical protein